MYIISNIYNKLSEKGHTIKYKKEYTINTIAVCLDTMKEKINEKSICVLEWYMLIYNQVKNY